MSSTTPAIVAVRAGRRVILRHSVLVRVTHWINALCFFFLLMSGLQIFNAHPALYWGNKSDFSKPFLALTARAGQRRLGQGGVTTIFGKSFTTTGVLGASRDENDQLVARGFPGWITIPSYQDLATGPALAFLFRLAAGAERRASMSSIFSRADTSGISCLPVANCVRSRLRSGRMRGCVFPKATKRCITTCCRSSPISPSSSRCRSWCWRA